MTELADRTALVEIGRARITPVGIEFPDAMTYDEWATLGARFHQVGDALKWGVGGWVLEGERRYGEVYAQAIEATGYEYATISNWAYVAKRFEFSRRRENVAWWVHAEITALPDDEQDVWLGLAHTQPLTRQQLRGAIKDYKRGRMESATLTKENSSDIHLDTFFKDATAQPGGSVADTGYLPEEGASTPPSEVTPNRAQDTDQAVRILNDALVEAKDEIDRLRGVVCEYQHRVHDDATKIHAQSVEIAQNTTGNSGLLSENVRLRNMLRKASSERGIVLDDRANHALALYTADMAERNTIYANSTPADVVRGILVTRCKDMGIWIEPDNNTLQESEK